MFLLVGGDSSIGAATAALLEQRGVPFVATSRRPGAPLPLDLRRVDQFEVPNGVTAACIFAAVARLADCAADPASTRAINVDGPVKLAQRLAGTGVYTLFLSTDKVFDGTRPTVPSGTPTAPISEYGRQKAAAEAALIALNAPVGVLRLSKVLPRGMPLFVNWDRDLRAGRPVKAFAEMRLAPVPAAIVGTTILDLLERRHTGIRQLSGPRDVSYFDVARFIARCAGVDEGLVERGDTSNMPAGSLIKHTTLATEIPVPDPFDVVEEALEAALQKS